MDIINKHKFKTLIISVLLSLSIYSQERQTNKDLLKKEKKDVFEKIGNKDEFTLDTALTIVATPEIATGLFMTLNGYMERKSALNRLKSNSLINKAEKSMEQFTIGRCKGVIRVRNIGKLKIAAGAYLIADGVTRIIESDGLFFPEKKVGVTPLLKLTFYNVSDMFDYLKETDMASSGEILEADMVISRENIRLNETNRDSIKAIEQDPVESRSVHNKRSQKKT